jgi:hypothetical protein
MTISLFSQEFLKYQSNKYLMKKIYALLSLMIFSFAANAQCSGLFFSEYLEGSSNNKALEIYNASGSAIDLSDYAVIRMNNGSTTSPDTFRMKGMLASEAVYVIANAQANAAILAVADTTGRATFYNGDDALTLANITTSTVVDLFGVPGVDPGSAWTWGSGTTADATLVRNYNVQSGVTAWDTLEWVASAVDDASNLGSHSSACYPPTATEPATAASNPTQDAVDVISIYSQSYTDPASIDYYPNWGQSTQYNVFVIGTDSMGQYSNLNYQGIDFDSNEIDASAMEYLHLDVWTADIDNFMVFPISRGGEKSVTTALNKGSWTSLDIPLSEYTSQGLSMSDIFQLKLEDPDGSGGTVFIDNIYFWKMPTLVYEVAEIADVVGLDANFSPEKLDMLYELTGVVYGVDMQGGERLSFTIIDATDGIGVFNDLTIDGYVVTEGDEVTVKGKIGFFRGMTQIVADAIVVNSTGNELKDPTDVTSLSEATESDLVKLTKVWLVDDAITVWPSNGNIDVTNGTDTMTLRIDSDSKGIADKTIDNDTMNIVGLGGQFKFDAPYNSGYQLFPRDSTDITKWVELVSVKEVTIDARVYPNPASNNLTVIGAQRWNTYMVYNILGGKVSEGTLTNNSLSVAELNVGTYIVKLYAGENTGVARFVVNK